MFNFEKLEVWHKSIQFADLVYEISAGFPGDERFGLTSQIRRAAISVSANIAEGSSRHSASDFRRFIEIATGSTFEVISQARVAQLRLMLEPGDYARLYDSALEIVRMLSGLRSSLDR